MLRSSNGYLFAGTSNGLFKFDGISFSKIEINKPESTDSVTAVFQDNNNHIWIGCNSGRIAKAIDRKLQYIEPEEGTPKKRITSFVQDKEGNIWFGPSVEAILETLCQSSKRYWISRWSGGPVHDGET